MTKAIVKMNLLMGLVFFMLFMQEGSAREFSVGPSQSWGVPSSDNSYNKWAERNRFQINDSLVFVYPSSNDSVLVVTKEDYNNCSSNSPIAKFEDGHSVFTFNQSGQFYFISGKNENCLKGEKLIVVVLGDRTAANASPPAPAGMAPSPAPAGMAPSPAPAHDGTNETTPSPAPIGPETPPSGTGENIPTPAPESDQSPPKNSASAIFVTSIGSIGALVGSSLILSF